MAKELKEDVKFQLRLSKEVREKFKEACKFYGVEAAEDLRQYMKKKIKKYKKEIKELEQNSGA